MNTFDYDFLVIGSGLAGLITALGLAPHGKVALITKTSMGESNSAQAQGGVAAPVDPDDSEEKHVVDTLETGAGLCDPETVRAIVSQASTAIRTLESFGVRFERRAERMDEYHLGQEGGHSIRRVLHAGDFTGREIIRVLVDRIQKTPGIEVKDHWMAIDLVTTSWLKRRGENRCIGAYLLNTRTSEIVAARAAETILATGGCGKVYLYTSNPDVATGDGIAMAWRAGVPVRNMEFVQFHPTCLFHPAAKSFLISEAVRGEGARLLNAAGERFMFRYDPRGELAPRDITARAIDQEMKTRGDPCVFLDITHQPESFILARFPNIFAMCLKYGINMARDHIPVVPAAHYFCGGIEASVDGRTALPGLSACGEVACTGLHGANRLASNSLLEALVGGMRTAQRLARQPRIGSDIVIPDWVYGDAVPSDEAVVVEHNWNEIRSCMWDYVGIVRTNKRLERALRRIRNLREEIRQYYLDYLPTSDVLELRNIASVAELVVRSAMQRKESRGLHYTLDYPDPLPQATDTRLVDPPGGGGH